MPKNPQYEAARKAQAQRQAIRGGPLTGKRSVWRSRPGAAKRASDYTQPRYYGPQSGAEGGGWRKPVWRKPPPPGAPLYTKK